MKSDGVDCAVGNQVVNYIYICFVYRFFFGFLFSYALVRIKASAFSFVLRLRRVAEWEESLGMLEGRVGVVGSSLEGLETSSEEN